MKMKRNLDLNSEQLAIIDAKEPNIVVTASAGAGKTRVLVERYIKRLIEDEIKIDEIVALTFTDAASEEMKNRIKERIDELLEDRTNTSEEIETLKRIKNDIDGAQISTIHSFCLKLIKEYYFLLGLDADRINNIVDDAMKANLKNEAFNITINNTKDYIDNVAKVSNNLFSLDSFKEALDNIVDVAATHYNPREFFINKKDVKADAFEDINPNIRKYYFDELKAYVNVALSSAQELLKTDAVWNPLVKELKDVIETTTYSDMFNKIKMLPGLPNLPKGSPLRLINLRKHLGSILSSKIGPRLIDENDLLKDYNETIEYNNYLLKVANDYYDNYETLKKKHNVIDFNDFEHYAYALLTLDNNRLANKLKNKFKEIMIDEFQDTNDTQFSIISLITNKNLFVVGDIKQSIYRFRDANPNIMLSLIKDPDYKNMNMTFNYRSCASIVNFNNDLYSSLMNYYDSNTFKDDDLQQFGGKVEGTEIPRLILADKDVTDRYGFFADEIKRLVNNGVNFKDICILTKDHDKKKVIKELLLKNNIPCISFDKDSYLTTKSLDVLYSYFKYLLNNDDLIAKCAILSSSIYKISDEDLVLIRDDKFNNENLNNDVINLKPFVENNDIMNIINYILNINNYYYDLTIQQKTDIDLFVTELDSMNVNTLADLVSYIDTNRDLPGNDALVVTKDDDAVKLMTIHSSKGLQFKHVLLLSESQIRASKASSAVLCDSELGVGTYNIFGKYDQKRPSIKRMAILAKENVEALLEYQRLFYVATTRAIESLTIIDEACLLEDDGTYTTIDNKLSLLYNRKGFTSYLLNYYHTDSKDYYSWDVPKTLKYPDKLKEKETNVDKDYVPTNAFNTSIIESKRASDISNSIVLKEVFEFGNNVHKYFETLDINAPTNENEIKEIFKGNSTKIIKAVNNFKSSELIQKIKSYDIYHEYSYVYKKDKAINRGSIDFLAIDKDIIYLIDFKTDRKLTKDELKKHYQNQIRTYRDILKQKYNQVIVSYLYSIELAEFIEM